MSESFLAFKPLAFAGGRYWWGLAPVTIKRRRVVVRPAA
jgi:hypothetical protein